MTARRVGAFAIDFTLMACVVVALRYLTGMESLGHVAVHVVLMLVRDVTGASPGKLMLGLRVVAEDGGTASVPRRILRNVTLLTFLADVDPVQEPIPRILTGFAVLIWLVEVFLVVTDHTRLGDRLAGTRVVQA